MYIHQIFTKYLRKPIKLDYTTIFVFYIALYVCTLHVNANCKYKATCKFSNCSTHKRTIHFVFFARR